MPTDAVPAIIELHDSMFSNGVTVSTYALTIPNPLQQRA